MENWIACRETNLFASARVARGAEAASLATIGRLCPGTAVCIVREGARPVPPGEVGEILVRGPGVSPGYLGDAPLTADRFLSSVGGDGLVPEGWWHKTGDLGRETPVRAPQA